MSLNHKVTRQREYIASCADCRRERKAKRLAHVAKLIRREVNFFNGWSVSEKSVDSACEKAAQKILNYLRRPR